MTVAIELFPAGVELADIDMFGFIDAALLPFVKGAHVEQGPIFAVLSEPACDFLGVDHGNTLHRFALCGGWDHADITANNIIETNAHQMRHSLSELVFFGSD